MADREEKTWCWEMSLVKYTDIFLTNMHVISVLGLLIISISLSICSRNCGYMNLYHLEGFGYKWQKPILANLNRIEDLGKDMEQWKE